ncbi:FAD-binding oxidoreductase [Shinella daejeonensis]|uniref:NAD(P)/FAD-dependent oxidoreductase n=1 Tax=Shinella daejeonensis TaxID=659017 RepID=UPI0020C7AAEB|nr:FAD-binding oxidoreductase [Shinella daejeonensis]MCP8894857.1 FAD-binding oxidoreductase [Shinella daejeonensis]
MTSWPVDPPSSLWRLLSREVFSAPALRQEIRADIVVVGGGIAGLATAVELRDRGHDVVVLEAAHIGHGASGRANGQVISALTRHGPDALRALWPGKRGDRFIALVAGSADRLYGLIERYAIDCDARRNGWLQPAHTEGRARRVAALAAQWAEAGAPAAAVDAATMSARVGTDAYCGGWEHRGGGHINPYAFTLGLARGAAADGVRIFETSPALRLTRQGDLWQVETPAGRVLAGKVALATAAHSGDLWPDFRRSLVPVTSYQAATPPLGAFADTILPGDEAASDTRMDLRYFRKDREGRLVSGGALALQLAAHRRVSTLVAGRLAKIFPGLPRRPMGHVWSGRIAMTTDRLPHLHRRADGLVAWAGCNGRGLALACAMADVMADALEGVPDEALALRPSPPSPLPLHGLVARCARLILPWYRWKDAREIPFPPETMKRTP